MIGLIRCERVRAAAWLGAGVLVALLTMSAGGCAAGGGGRTFATPEEGTRALVAALQPFNEGELIAILGPDGKEVISSGDDVADRSAAESFVESYQRKHRVVVEEDEATLVVGDDDWPLPIPLVRTRGAWRFDTDAGKDELLARRVGRNELAAIESCRALVDAQQEFAALNAAGGPPVYAQKFASDPGQRNGLYWETRPGDPPSPLGPLVAEAVAEGYGGGGARPAEAGPRPFHGYCFRMLTAQGPSAPGGARSFLVNGKMTGGFGAVAWPVEYGNSGIMTFIVSDDGVVYQKDLGDETEKAATAMTAFDPGEGWEIVP